MNPVSYTHLDVYKRQSFQSLWRDEVDSIRFATRALSQVVGMFAKPGENGPLFFALLRVWLAGAGSSEFALRFQAVLAGVLAVPLTYVLVRQLMKVVYPSYPTAIRGLTVRNVALVAAMLVAVNPYLTWYSQEGKMYSVLVVAVLATQLAFLGEMCIRDSVADDLSSTSASLARAHCSRS